MEKEIQDKEKLQALVSKMLDAIPKDEKSLQYKKSKIAREVFEKDKEFKYLSVAHAILSLDLNFESQMFTILSYGVLVDCFNKLGELTNEEAIVVALATIGVTIDEYTLYAGVLTQKAVATAIVESDPDIHNQKEVACKIMDKIYDYYVEDILYIDNEALFEAEAITIVNTNKKNR